MSGMISRRRWLAQTATLAALTPLAAWAQRHEAPVKSRFRIGACDWSIGNSSNIKAFDVAKSIGLEGIQVNMGSLANGLHLRQPALQEAYLEASQRTGITISSLAIAELNNIPYKSDARTEEWVWDSIDVAKKLHAPVVLLAFFGKNDLRQDEQGQQEVIRRLKIAAPKAEKNGVILGIESYLNAAEHLRIIDAVGSASVQCYYDFRNTADAGFDAVKEFKALGRQHVCELHMKENGSLLEKGTLNWAAVAEAVKQSGFDGWMQIEGALPAKADITDSYRQNLRFLRSLFPQ